MPYLGAYANINELVTLAPLNLSGFITARAGIDAVLYGWYPTDNTTPADGYSVIRVPDTVGRWKTLGSDISIPGETDQVIIVAATFLALPDATDLADGATAFVQSRLAYYSVYRGAWTRSPIAHPSWRLQEEWSIDSGVGSDDAAGTLLLPLATYGEFLARMGDSITINNKIHVYFQTDTPSLNINVHITGNSESGLFFHGKRNVIGSGVFTNGTISRVTLDNTSVTIVDTENPFDSFVGNLIVVTGPPSARVGATSVILSASGITAQAGTFSKFNSATPGSTPTEIVPESNDSYQIFECSTISELSIRTFSDSVNTRIGLDSFTISLASVGTFLTEGCNGVISNCVIDNLGIQTDGRLCTRHNVSDSSTGSVISGTVSAGAFFTNVISKNITLNLGVIFQECKLHSDESDSTIIANDVGFFDWAGDAITVTCGTELYNKGIVWGASPSGDRAVAIGPDSGVRIKGGSTFVARFPITSGSVYDFTFNNETGGVESPAFDTITQTFTTLRQHLWSLMDTTVALGGFGNLLKEPRTGAWVVRDLIS